MMEVFFSGFLNSLPVWLHSNWSEERFGGALVQFCCLAEASAWSRWTGVCFIALQMNKTVVKSCLSPNKQALERVLRSSHLIYSVMLCEREVLQVNPKRQTLQKTSAAGEPHPDDSSVPRYKPKNTVWKKPAAQECPNCLEKHDKYDHKYEHIFFTLINIWFGGYCICFYVFLPSSLLKPVLWKSLDVFN